VFSFRNDITQRRETIEATFQALIQKYPFAIPRDIIKEQEQEVLRAVSQTPDYRVYKSQRDFSEKVRMLATKQLKECIIVDEIASQEGITLTTYDVQCYFNFLKRPRMKKFIYFDLPKSQLNGQETPLPASIIHQACLREKTLNHIIRHIIKQI
jgi:FKBP-type peptidyl-prolyl cis-trans isomerase (trigger factor)